MFLPFFIFFVFLETSLFPSIFVPFPLSLCMERGYVVRSFLFFRMVFFVPCDHGLDFSTTAYVRIQSKIKSVLYRVLLVFRFNI